MAEPMRKPRLRIEVRPTVAADLPHLIEIDLPHRIRAVTALRGSEILGAGGIGWRPDGTVMAFAIIKDEGRKYPAAIWRAGQAVIRIIRDSRVPLVIAEAEEGNHAAVPFLVRLGFKPRRIGGVLAFVWERADHVA